MPFLSQGSRPDTSFNATPLEFLEALCKRLSCSLSGQLVGNWFLFVEIKTHNLKRVIDTNFS